MCNDSIDERTFRNKKYYDFGIAESDYTLPSDLSDTSSLFIVITGNFSIAVHGLLIIIFQICFDRLVIDLEEKFKFHANM